MAPATRILPILLLGSAACGAVEDQPDRAPPPPLPTPTRHQTYIPPPQSAVGAPVPEFTEGAPLSVLLIGNSHVVGLVPVLEALFAVSEPERSLQAVRGPFQPFLVDHWHSNGSQHALGRGSWTHVILQGQKYSQSGVTTYPTDATRAWIARAKEFGVVPILFPEHPQVGRLSEGRYVHAIHESIAEEEPACVAPVGLVWDRVIASPGSPDLHEPDGNHAADAGTVLTAVVLHDVLVGTSSGALSGADVRVSAEDLALFEEQAAATLADHPPCP